MNVDSGLPQVRASTTRTASCSQWPRAASGIGLNPQGAFDSGNHIHPVEIECALNRDYGTELEKRNLQLEAEAHVAVQEWIDAGGLEGRAATAGGLAEIHRRFCECLPDELLRVEGTDSKERLRVIPDDLRQRDVKVGRHVPVSPGAVPRFLERFALVYGNLGATDAILASAAAHHLLLWIHPFLDGNGRVARLMSHAMLRDALDTGGVWSIARGLARSVVEYKAQLATCDLTRRNDLDGRGSLSEEALADFTRFLLRACIGQVTFYGGAGRPEPASGADSDLGGRGGPRLHPATQIGGRDRGGAVPGRAAARRRRSSPGDRGAAGAACDLRPGGAGSSGVGKLACTASTGLPREACVALDARAVSGCGGMTGAFELRRARGGNSDQIHISLSDGSCSSRVQSLTPRNARRERSPPSIQ